MEEPTPAGRGRRAPVMKSVAERAGVSQKTVSRVVNNEPNVSDALRDRVLAAIAELGYRPNNVARALVTRRTHLIALVTFGTPLYGPSATMMGVIRAAREGGFGLSIFTTSENDPDEIHSVVSEALDAGAEGILLFEPVASVVVDEPQRLGVPMVIIGERSSNLGYSTIGHMVQDGAALATRHLLDLGHRTVHHITGPLTWQTSLERIAGWRNALATAGAPEPATVQGDWSAASGYRIASTMLRDPEVTAVFVANDQMAMGTLRAAAELGLRIPHDVSIVGYDDLPEAEFQIIPLTTIRQEFDEIATNAVEHLIDLIDSNVSAPVDIRVPMQLIVRASTGPPGRAPGEGRLTPIQSR